MSTATKCDGCGKLYEDEPGSATIELIHVMTRKPPSMANWSEVDLCVACAAPILKLLEPACIGLRKTLKGR